MLAVYVSTRIDTRGFMTFIVRTNSILACDSGAIRNLTQVFGARNLFSPLLSIPAPAPTLLDAPSLTVLYVASPPPLTSKRGV